MLILLTADLTQAKQIALIKKNGHNMNPGQ